MGLPRSDIRRIFALAMVGGLGLGVLVYGFVRLVEGAPPAPAGRSLLMALLVGGLIGLAMCAAVKLALRQAAYELHAFAVELTDTALPAPVPTGGDDVVYMRETLSTALAFVPRSDALPRLAQELAATADPGEALALAAGQIAQHLPVRGAVLLVLDAERGALVPVASWGLARLDHAVALDLDSTALGRALVEGRSTDYSGLQVRELLPLQRGPEALTMVCLPQFVRGQPFATLCLVAEGAEVRLSDEQRAFARGVADLLTLAVQSGLNRRLFARESERLVAFEQLGGVLTGSQRLDQALEQVLRVAARVTDSAHGTLLLLEHDESRVRYRVALSEGYVLPISVTAAPILKHGLAGWALRERRADTVEDTERDARWLPVPGLEAMRSALVVPLLYGERALGVLTLADPAPRHYSRRSLALCSALAAHAVTILARVQYEEIVAPGSAALARRMFEGHVGAESLADLLGDGQALRAALDPQSRELVVLYAGLRGLDRLELEPVQLVEQILGPAVSALAAISHEHQGYLSLCENGAMLLAFGYPVGHGDTRVRALRAAQAVQAAARRLRNRWRAQLGADLALSAGLAAGPLATGVVGDERFSAVSLVGAPLAEAARIQRLARHDEVLVADSLASSFGVEGPFPLERLAPLDAAEGEAPRSVYRLAPGR
ncbi:MAG TPA: GAF domain-containing protein [Chloroflexaceae bacterium]|nr:GAF domain-containing protein [Chloroflexaceae bacterium]